MCGDDRNRRHRDKGVKQSTSPVSGSEYDLTGFSPVTRHHPFRESGLRRGRPGIREPTRVYFLGRDRRQGDFVERTLHFSRTEGVSSLVVQGPQTNRKSCWCQVQSLPEWGVIECRDDTVAVKGVSELPRLSDPPQRTGRVQEGGESGGPDIGDRGERDFIQSVIGSRTSSLSSLTLHPPRYSLFN